MGAIATSAVNNMKELAHNNYYGYSQNDRWNHDRDCSSAVIDSYTRAGLDLYGAGARSTWDMVPVMKKLGFKDVTGSVNLRTGAGMLPGDVLMKTGHTGMITGPGMIVEATCDEYGGIEGKNPGDQTGTEIWEHPYNGGFSQCLRLEETEGIIVEFSVVCPGDRGPDVSAAQALLRGRSYKGEDGKLIVVDGVYGVPGGSEPANTYHAVCKFQKDHGLDPDGEIGQITWPVLLFR